MLWLVLCRHLSNEWSVNEQYSYGWFVPFFAAYLFWLRWENRPTAEPPSASRRNALLFLVAIPALLFLLPLRLFEIAAPDWRPLGWFHAGVVVAVTLVGVWYLGGKRWLRHFFFPVAFILVAVPWPVWFEGGTTNHLMGMVASIAAEAVALCGIPAQVEGSVIRLSTGVVGVSEACSGVRSLQTSIMIGLLFGELKRLDLLPRVWLLAAAGAIAMVANVCRTIFLVYVASTQGINAVAKWHDVAGYSIVGVVFIGTVGMAAALARRRKVESRKAKVENELSAPAAHHAFLLPTSYFLLPLVWLLFVEAGVEFWYRVHESASIERVHWTVRWPESAPAFREIPTEQFRPTLAYNEGCGAAWLPSDDSSSGTAAAKPRLTYLLYFFHWQPGRGSVLHARTHQPDQCLPNTGWKQSKDDGTRQYRSGKIALPFHHFEFVRQSWSGRSAEFAHAFYCVRADSVSPERENGTNKARLLGDRFSEARSDFLRAVREGERNRAQQVMEFIIVGQDEISTAEAESRFADFVRESVVEAPQRVRADATP